MSLNILLNAGPKNAEGESLRGKSEGKVRDESPTRLERSISQHYERVSDYQVSLTDKQKSENYRDSEL